MSSFFSQKSPKNFLTPGVFAGTFLAVGLLFVGKPSKSYQIRKGKNHVRSSSEYYTADLCRNRFGNRRICHLWVHKRLR